MSDAQQRYDAVLYPGVVHPWSHPRSVGALARLHGIDAAPFEACRVLDIGCGTATNLVSMAFDAPGSAFVGIDIAPRQIERGRQVAQALGLQNTTLLAQGIEALDPSVGLFDYVIAHGVYSWVPTEVRAALLGAARRVLKPSGVLYVSYNCYPGWHAVDAVRELMLRRTDAAIGPLERAQQARQVLAAMVAASDPAALTSVAMQAELDHIRTVPDAFLAHEYLEPTQGAVYFEDFVGHARSHGLRYACNAEPTGQLPATQGPRIRQAMEAETDRAAQQQVYDHLTGARFRRTLLVRDDHLEPRLALDPAVVESFHARLPDPEVARGEGADLVLVLDESRQVRVPPGPLADWIGRLRAEWPSSVPVRDLTDVAAPAGAAAAQLAFTGAIELSTSPVSAASVLVEKPVGSPLARVQARFDPLVCSRSHRSESLEPLEWDVLQKLDGTRTLDQVATELGADRDQVQEMAEGLLERALLV